MPVYAKGLDFAWSKPRATSVQAAGYQFEARYYSRDQSKLLTPLEEIAASAAGLRMVTVFEDSAQQARLGTDQGHADGAVARWWATLDHQPTTSPIYIAFDYQAPPSDWPQIAAYVDAFQAEAGYPAGGYGDYYLLRQLLADGHVQWLWQTIAWSDGLIHPQMNIYQTGAQAVIDGNYCDINYAYTQEYGSWLPATTEVIQTEPHVVATH